MRQPKKVKISLKAKKSFGQHFLHNKHTIDRIARLVLDSGMPRVLEVGPGKAALTRELILKVPEFLAIDADPDMVRFLKSQYPGHEDSFVLADFLRFDLKQIFDGQEFLLFGNFPYNISSQIVFKALENRDRVPLLLGMFQKEMAKRIVATEGSKDYGILAVLSAQIYRSRLLFDIDPGQFTPPPKVMSSFIGMERLEEFPSKVQFDKLHRLVKTAFQFRRKTLRNNLKGIAGSEDILRDAYFDQRPEQISPGEYLRLAGVFYPDTD